MADNTTQNGTDTIGTDELSTLNGSASSGVKVQRVKAQYGDNNDARDVSEAYPLPTIQYSATPTVTTVAASATSVTVIAANTARRGLVIHNSTGSATAYVRLGTSTATASSGGYTLEMLGGALYEVPFGYRGAVTAIWASATGFVNVTEIT